METNKTLFQAGSIEPLCISEEDIIFCKSNTHFVIVTNAQIYVFAAICVTTIVLLLVIKYFKK